MRIGFTGTQKGMTAPQKLTVSRLIAAATDCDSFNMGDCVGADKDFYDIAKVFRPDCTTVGHIPDNDSKRAFCKYTFERKPLPYIERNHTICEESQMLIAAPGEDTEKLRSGTWATIRYMRKLWKKIIIVWPDGSMTTEEKSLRPPDKNVDSFSCS